MAVPTLITDLSTTPASNSPAGSENVFPNLDDYLRVQAAFLASIRDNSGNGWVSPYLPLAGGTMTGTVAGLQVSSLNGGAISLRNKIINGDMRICQRATSTTGVSTTQTFVVDRFRTGGQVTSAVVTTSQASDGPSTNLGQSARVIVTTADNAVASGDIFGVVQVIEGYNIIGLLGNTFTISFWVRSSKTGTHCVRLTNSTPDRTYIAEYTVIAANTWEYKTITVSGGLTTAGTWDLANGAGLNVGWALMAGSTFQTTAGAWQTANFWSTSNQVNCLDTIGNIFAITGVQVEVGPVATPFEQSPIGMELALCQRYSSPAPLGRLSGYTAGGQNVITFISFPIMRAAPTLSGATYSQTNATIASLSNFTTMGCTFSANATAAGSFDIQVLAGYLNSEL